LIRLGIINDIKIMTIPETIAKVGTRTIGNMKPEITNESGIEAVLIRFTEVIIAGTSPSLASV
jgi:hypothetical protein